MNRPLEPSIPSEPSDAFLETFAPPPPWDEPPRTGPGGARSGVPGRRLRRWLAIALLVAAPLLVAETGVRLLIAADRLPVASAHLRDFEISWENLGRLGRADVLILGDSVSQQGIEPRVLARQLAKALGRPVTVFNAASPAGGFGINRAIVQQLATEGRLPRVAIIGIQPGILQDDDTFREVFAVTPMGGLLTDCEVTGDYVELVNCRMSNLSALWRWRGRPDRLLTAIRSAGPRGSRHGGLVLREDGFRAGRPVGEAQLRRQLKVAIKKQPPFRMGDDARLEYRRLVELLREHGVTVIPVAVPNIPLLLEAVEKKHPGWEAARGAAIRRLEEETGVDIVDPLRLGPWFGDDSARNIKHLSVRGARDFTQQLWGITTLRGRLVAALGS